MICQSLSCDVVRDSSIVGHSSLSSVVAIAPSLIGQSPTINGEGWQDALHVLKSLGINMHTGGG